VTYIIFVGAESQAKICKLCRQDKPATEFCWEDDQGNKGETSRCTSCRRRKRHRDPTLPQPAYWIRSHAIDRYRQRVHPELTFTQAKDEMIRLMDGVPLQPASPWWHAGRKADGLLCGYLQVRPGLLFVVGYYPGDITRGAAPRVKTVLVKERPLMIGYRRLCFWGRRLKRRWRLHFSSR